MLLHSACPLNESEPIQALTDLPLLIVAQVGLPYFNDFTFAHREHCISSFQAILR